MDFFERAGRMAIGSRLRLLTDAITQNAVRIYDMYGVKIRPKWFPVVFSLTGSAPKTITAIAKEIGHTHPSVSNIVKEMKRLGLLEEFPDKTDKRRNAVALSAKGLRLSRKLEIQCRDVETAVENISRETHHDLWQAIEEWEYALARQSLYARVKEIRYERERQAIEIVPYAPEYRSVFRELNEKWITSHWEMEANDYKVLDHPEEYILAQGGYIFVALYERKPVGVCALMKMNHPKYNYELAKYAVSPQVQGLGIGTLLGKTAIAKAEESGAAAVFLESNRLLKPAIHLYRKLGFHEIADPRPMYARGDIQMELILKPVK